MYNNIQLNLYMMQFAIQFFEFQYFTNEKVSITVRYLRVGDVNHIMINIEIQLEKKKTIFVIVSIYFMFTYFVIVFNLLKAFIEENMC